MHDIVAGYVLMNIIKGAIIGLVCTVVLYMVPLINALSPFFGGFLGGYVASEGAFGGFKVGVLMSLLAAIPGFMLSGALALLLADVPVLGAILAGSGIFITFVIVIYTAIFGIIGGVVGGAVADNN
ncbi:hypothetical protein SAMN04488587_1504 [Methanococcoides vulcani]|uniref:DUF5518 domain-containing protein n=2 Tax=Methanosarcinaceae TaxID=2206 RepID=A0A1I0A9A0_9EURY|nr:hypothetical protein SAMN04488587_1504 [Methanococcoides vulcani]